MKSTTRLTITATLILLSYANYSTAEIRYSAAGVSIGYPATDTRMALVSPVWGYSYTAIGWADLNGVATAVPYHMSVQLTPTGATLNLEPTGGWSDIDWARTTGIHAFNSPLSYYSPGSILPNSTTPDIPNQYLVFVERQPAVLLPLILPPTGVRVDGSPPTQIARGSRPSSSVLSIARTAPCTLDEPTHDSMRPGRHVGSMTCEIPQPLVGAVPIAAAAATPLFSP